ncbi:Ppx/GppA phosphatase family protein [soil metagenome]
MSTRLIAPRGGAQHRPDQSPEKLSLTAVIYGCIDIGSNTTRLLVATGGARAQRCATLTDSVRQPLRQLMAERSFTRIGRSLGDDGRIPKEKIAETAAVAGAQARLAREMGAGTVAAVATAAVRDAVNRDELVAAVEHAADVELRVLPSSEEARLSFAGATRTLPEPARGIIAVVDVGGGSTEIAVGAPDGTVEWSQSVRVGSGLLADTYLRSDPPALDELDAARERVGELFSTLAPPVARVAVAVGGSATSLRRLVGGDLDERTLAEGVAVLSRTRIEEVARRFALDPERVRLLPAGIIVLGAACGCLGLPLRIARGGLREGVILDLMDGSRPEGI